MLTALLIATTLSIQKPYLLILRWKEMNSCLVYSNVETLNTKTITSRGDGTFENECGSYVDVDHAELYDTLEEVRARVGHNGYDFTCESVRGLWDLRYPKRIDVGCSVIMHPEKERIVDRSWNETVFDVDPR